MTPEELQQKIEKSLRGGGILDVTIDGRNEYTLRKVIQSHRRDASGAITWIMFNSWDELRPLEYPPKLHDVSDNPIQMEPSVMYRRIAAVSVPEINESFK